MSTWHNPSYDVLDVPVNKSYVRIVTNNGKRTNAFYFKTVLSSGTFKAEDGNEYTILDVQKWRYAQWREM